MSGQGNIGSFDVFVYFAYGLAFFSLGIVTALQSRAMSGLRSIRPLWLLSVFGLLHGASEWIELAIMGGWLPGDSATPFNLVLRLASFAFLIQFGAEFLLAVRGRSNRLRAISPLLIVLWLVTALGIAIAGVGAEYLLATMDGAMRYIVAFPGSMLAAYGLWVGSYESQNPDAPGKYFRGAAVAFAVYAVVGGLVVPPSPIFPASLLNQVVFADNLGVPVVLVRTLCAMAVSGCLAEAFVVEISRSQVRMVAVLQQMDQMREEFISVVAHDLRSPVAVVSGYADLLKGLPPEGHGAAVERHAIEGIAKSAKHLDRMVGDLLDASRIDARRLVLQKEWIDLPQLVADVVAENRLVTAGHEVSVRVENEIPKLHADPARLDQILNNLLSNAAKYSSPKSPITVALSAVSTQVEVAVVNLGAGIPSGERERIFTRFYRTREAAESEVSGIGLGLYITKGLVEAHGGRIWVESRPTACAGEEQTSFRFVLPVEKGVTIT